MQEVIKRIYDYSLEEIMGERFGEYAKSIIQDRAIPDVRDGLKPVQRRILYGMYRDKNTYDKPYRKSAKSVGIIMGNYHPHGDSSIYDAMVRMSQWWKQNTPYIDMHGNNGSMDGDSPAAMRYTEARLAKISNELLKDIDKDTISWAPNFDDTELEPTVLPAKFPNLLVNGATGISAGYATNIPPHNLGEVIDATIKRIDNPNCRLETIMDIMPGPDFPTGGIIEGKKGIEDAFCTGRGRIVIRSKVEFVEEKGRNQLVITEIPFEVNREGLARAINDIRIDKKVDGILDVRNESSDRIGLRIAIDMKKDANKDLILNYLYKNTDLQVSYNYNMVVINNRRPMTLGVLPVLDAYISFQKEVIEKRTRFDLDVANRRLHIVDGYLKAISILDELIKVIRASKDKADAGRNIVAKFGFTEIQAKAILDLQLYRLTNLDIVAFTDEASKLKLIIHGLQAILADENKLRDVMKKELRDIKKEYATPRKSVIHDEITEIKIEKTEMITKEDCMVVVTKEGYVKRVSLRSYGASNGEAPMVKDGDYPIGIYEMNTLDTLLLFTDMGNYLYVPVHEIPDLKWKELGKHISNIIKTKADENIISSIPVYAFDDKHYITLFSRNGMVKRTLLSEFEVTRYSKPIVCMKLKGDDRMLTAVMSPKKDIFIATHQGYGLWFGIEEVPMSGVKSSGVKAIGLKNDYVVSATLFDGSAEYVTVITEKNTAKRIKISEFDKTSRARRGLLLVREVKTNPYHILKVFLVSHKTLLGIKTKEEQRTFKITECPITDRYSTGSVISKQAILDSYPIVEPQTKEQTEDNAVIEVPKENVSLKEVDERIMTIDDFLDEIEDHES